MGRVVVIGNAGGGKSTLCRILSRAKGLPLYEIDRIQWQPGWVPTPAGEVRQWHDRLLAAEERWIIDGWGGWENIETRFQAADTIIFVDFPLPVHYWWALKRQVACLFRPREGGPDGCPLPPMTGRLLKVMWQVHHEARPRLAGLVERYRGAAQKRIFHLRSPRELRQFIREHGRAA